MAEMVVSSGFQPERGYGALRCKFDSISESNIMLMVAGAICWPEYILSPGTLRDEHSLC